MAIGRAIAATSADGTRSGVIGICRLCTKDEARLPSSLHIKRLQPAMERALADPVRYLCTPYDDIGAAVLAVALVGHPDYATRTLQALGWVPDGCDTFTGNSPDMPGRLRRGTAIR
jgi:hypothetical protein